jgi:Sulfate permease and related transporters (MFS superfamily)
LKHILGISADGHNLAELVVSLGSNLGGINWITALIGVLATGFLFWVRKGLKPVLTKLGLGAGLTGFLVKLGPIVVVVATTAAVWYWGLDARGVKIVGDVPQSLPPFTLPSFSPALLGQLLLPAFLISIIGFVESISVAQTLAAKKRQRIDPDQELIGLGGRQYRRIADRWLSGDGRIFAVCRELRCGCGDTGCGGLYRRWAGDCGRRIDAADLFPADRDLGCDDHRGGAEPCGFLDPETQLGL